MYLPVRQRARHKLRRVYIADIHALPFGTVTIEAELVAPLMSVRLLHVDLRGANDTTLCDAMGYRLDLSLTPRPSTRLSYLDRWVPYRFENAGRFFVLPPGQSARLNSQAGCNTSIICNIDPNICATWLDEDLVWTEKQLEAGTDVVSPKISSLMVQLMEEVRNPGFASEALTQAYGIELVINLQRYFLGVNEQSAAGGLSPWRLRIIEERLQDGLSSPTLIELAELCRLSVRQLSRGFRESRGISVGEYIANHRLNQAKDLLLQGHSVKSVAFATGFKSASSFCHAFRKMTGVAPNQYRLSSRN